MIQWYILAILIWLSILGLIVALIALCIAVYETRKLITQVRRLIKKVSSRDLNMEISNPDDSTGNVTIRDGWEDGIENPRD